MTAAQLIELLSDCPPDAEVLFTYQENYPLQDTVRGVYDPAQAGAEICSDCRGTGRDDDETCLECEGTGNEKLDEESENTVWIVSNGQHRARPYGPRNAWDACERP